MSDGAALRMRWRVGSSPASVAYIRQHAAQVLARWGCPGEAADSAVLVLSELVTNAVVHADPPGGDVVVRLTVRPADCIRLEVGDQSPVTPKATDSGDDDEHGRGLVLVESFSRDWGVDARPSAGCAKRVWAVIDLTPPTSAGCVGATARDVAPADGLRQPTASARSSGGRRQPAVFPHRAAAAPAPSVRHHRQERRTA